MKLWSFSWGKWWSTLIDHGEHMTWRIWTMPKWGFFLHSSSFRSRGFREAGGRLQQLWRWGHQGLMGETYPQTRKTSLYYTLDMAGMLEVCVNTNERLDFLLRSQVQTALESQPWPRFLRKWGGKCGLLPYHLWTTCGIDDRIDSHRYLRSSFRKHSDAECLDIPTIKLIQGWLKRLK